MALSKSLWILKNPILKWDLAVNAWGRPGWITLSSILFIWKTFLRKARGYELDDMVACRYNSSLSKINIMLGQSPRPCPAITGLPEMTEGILWCCMTWDDDRTGQAGVSDHITLLIIEDGRGIRTKPRVLLITQMHYGMGKSKQGQQSAFIWC